jgi:hypothetical protein
MYGPREREYSRWLEQVDGTLETVRDVQRNTGVGHQHRRLCVVEVEGRSRVAGRQEWPTDSGRRAVVIQAPLPIEQALLQRLFLQRIRESRPGEAVRRGRDGQHPTVGNREIRYHGSEEEEGEGSLPPPSNQAAKQIMSAARE